MIIRGTGLVCYWLIPAGGAYAVGCM
eukprot:COSAG01_NODE_66792_length_269_cov_0.576471_1_plen_25_part_01